MFCGTFEENLFIRLSEDDRERIKREHKEVVPFESVSGRLMKEYVVIPKSLFNDKKQFSFWLNRSVDYVSSLPPKEKKKKKGGK
jgi:TfoX/Sxy family transcriptional regulator of competence genes